MHLQPPQQSLPCQSQEANKNFRANEVKKMEQFLTLPPLPFFLLFGFFSCSMLLRTMSPALTEKIFTKAIHDHDICSDVLDCFKIEILQCSSLFFYPQSVGVISFDKGRSYQQWKIQTNVQIFNFTSWPRDANSCRIFLMLMYCDPPKVIKPAIRADKAQFTVKDSKSNVKSAMFDVRVLVCKLNVTLVTYFSRNFVWMQIMTAMDCHPCVTTQPNHVYRIYT